MELPGAEVGGAGGGDGAKEIDVTGPCGGKVGGAGDGRMIGVGVIEADDVEGSLRGMAIGVEDGEGIDEVAVAKAGGVGKVFGGTCFDDFDVALARAADEDAAAFARIFGGGVAADLIEGFFRDKELE